ncbi:hypothetical protein ACJJTC_009470 [Scirpophaga incertulas]
MVYIKSVLILLILAAIKASDHVSHNLYISVYYESRCPDSRHFVLRQLKPAMDLLSSHIMLRLVPFGKSKSMDNGYGGFECQHGPSECLGNMVQSCTLDLMQSRTDIERVNYVACEMKRYAATNGDFSCVEKANVSPSKVNACIASGRGTQLQLDAEFYTKLVHPKFIPTITIDGIFNQKTQDEAQVDLIGTLCAMLKDTTSCAKYYNNMALQYILF